MIHARVSSAGLGSAPPAAGAPARDARVVAIYRLLKPHADLVRDFYQFLPAEDRRLAVCVAVGLCAMLLVESMIMIMEMHMASARLVVELLKALADEE